MVAFTQLFTAAVLAVAHTAAASCAPPVSFGTSYGGSDPATLAYYGVEFTEVQKPCEADYYASYKDLGVEFGGSYVWAQEAAARSEVKYIVRETEVIAPVKSAPVVVKPKCNTGCNTGCVQVCPSAKDACAL